MIVTSLLLCAALAQQDTLAPVERRQRADEQYLAADAREGRGVGTKGLQDAGAYIAAAFRRAGLKPGGDSGTYFQHFVIPADAPAVLHTTLGGTPVRNVVGYVPGTSVALRGQIVVIGAHYDHLGSAASARSIPTAPAACTTAPTTTPRAPPRCSSWRDASAPRSPRARSSWSRSPVRSWVTWGPITTSS